MSDPLMRLLAALPAAEPDAARADRVRARARAHFAERASRARSDRRRTPLWQPLVAALGLLYLITAIAEAVARVTLRGAG